MKIVETKYAGFWVRFLANSLDQLIFFVPILFILGQIMPFFIDFKAIKASSYPDSLLITEFLEKIIFIELIAIALWSALMAVFVAGKWQASPGKRIMNIYITKCDGSAPKVLESFLRFASLPVVMLASQIFARDEIYSKLDTIRANPAQYKTLEDIALLIPNSAVIEYSNLAAFVIAAVWLLMVNFTRQKTAFHDILFETRVVYGKK